VYKSLHFEPNQWPEKDNAEGSNCYSYALDRKDYHWAVPGHGFFSGITYEEYANKFNAYFTPSKFAIVQWSMVHFAMGYSGYVTTQSNATGIPFWLCSFR